MKFVADISLSTQTCTHGSQIKYPFSDMNMKQVKVILVAITQIVLHKKQIKQPHVSKGTITIINNRNTMCILLDMKYNIKCLFRAMNIKTKELKVIQYNILLNN
jgi:hypothetical protein